MVIAEKPETGYGLVSPEARFQHDGPAPTMLTDLDRQLGLATIKKV